MTQIAVKKILQIARWVGDFAEDKDWAAVFREQAILPVLAADQIIVLDFAGVTLATQSFVHALISNLLRSNGEDILDRLEFRNCAPGVRGIIETVVQYSLETTEEVTVRSPSGGSSEGSGE